MTSQRHRVETYHVNTCTVCEKEFEVLKGSPQSVCRACKDKKNEEDAIKALNYLLGAEIIAVVPLMLGGSIEKIIIRTRECRKLVLLGSGYGDSERYITVETTEE